MQDIKYKIVKMKSIGNNGIFGNILWTVQILLFFQYTYVACIAIYFSGKKKLYDEKKFK